MIDYLSMNSDTRFTKYETRICAIFSLRINSTSMF